MNFFKQLGNYMMLGARYQAQWELEVSNRIFGDRRRLFVLLLLMVPAVLGGIAFADEVSGALPNMIGGKSAYTPSFYSTLHFPGLDRHRFDGRADHRLHRGRRRIHHRPGADERRHQGHSRGGHRPVPHFRQGHHGQRHPPQTRQYIGSPGAGVSDRRRRRRHARRVDQPDTVRTQPGYQRRLHHHMYSHHAGVSGILRPV